MKKKETKQINKFSSGFTLVETLVAISIFVMSILALMSVLSSGIADTGYAKKKMVATYLAQEGIEYVRNQRDTAVLYSGDAQSSWNSFISSPPPVPPSPFDSSFTRQISMTPIGSNSDEVRITSTVTWTQGSGNYSVSFSEDLFNWIE